MYDCYIYEIENNALVKLNKKQINSLLSGNILEKKYKKNSVNIYYINKNYNFVN